MRDDDSFMLKGKYTTLLILLGGICCFIIACDTKGQIGDTANFKTSHPVLESAIDSLYAKYPEYKLPQKWTAYDNFSVRPSRFLFKKIFYFKSQPEEMYYVTLIDDSLMSGDTSRTGLAIRAINRGGEWIQQDKFSYKQKRKIQNRFEQEIIAKLKGFTKVKVEMEE